MKYIMLLLLLSGCGLSSGTDGLPGATGVAGPQGSTGDPGPVGPPGATPTPIPTLTDVQVLVQEYNNTRLAQNQDAVSQGMSCNIYIVPNTTTQIVGATLTNAGTFPYNGIFNQPNVSVTMGLNILPLSLQPVFQSWYILKCTGLLANTVDSWIEFDISSDDGANLYVDGTLLVNNDSLHGLQNKANVKFLSRAMHSFEIDYFQGAGNEALIVNMNGTLLQPSVLFH